MWFERIGRISARMHAHAKTWCRPAGFTRRNWDFNHVIGRQASWGSWHDALGLTPEATQLIAATVKKLEEITTDYGQNADNFGVIHADLRTANLLVDGETLHVIDFDDMGFGWYLFDFASSLSFLEQEPEAGELMRAWIKGYEEERGKKLSNDEKDLLPAFSIMRRIELTAWLSSHREIPFAKQQGEAFTADTARLCALYLQHQYLN